MLRNLTITAVTALAFAASAAFAAGGGEQHIEIMRFLLKGRSASLTKTSCNAV